MAITFAPSPRGTVGLEWELALIDAETGELANKASSILPELEKIWPAGDKKPHTSNELLQNTVELVSGAHERIADAVADLRLLARDLLKIAAEQGCHVIAPGCHPFSRWQDQLATDTPRYQDFMEKNGMWGRQLLIWGVHTHLGIADKERVIPIMHALMAYQPHLIALSASSPFWEGENSGYMSNRTMLFQQLSTAGVPFEMETWEDFERIICDLTRAEIISEPTESRWDVRPAPRWGTVEVRTCDGASTLDEIGAIGALTQCLGEEFNRRIDNGAELPRLHPWFIRENKWRAARFGMDAQIVVNNSGYQRSLHDLLHELCERLTPIAADIGCLPELQAAGVLVAKRENSAQRQVAEFERLLGIGASKTEAARGVAQMLADELRESVLG
ncbi:MAG: glutamate--cysteine ligase [Microbacteriaceae bacterium]|nr:glutamate--cysteine ligase [Microbacteriaceae bacterium]